MTTIDRDSRDALRPAQPEAPRREQAMARFAVLRPHLVAARPSISGFSTARPVRLASRAAARCPPAGACARACGQDLIVAQGLAVHVGRRDQPRPRGRG
ncbi:MAG TPA: hypothetical protein VLW50_07810 [Streptosporangiaceae bacterium]|nr:hypothetical protein [Streptosporangiaceae bacterium]